MGGEFSVISSSWANIGVSGALGELGAVALSGPEEALLSSSDSSFTQEGEQPSLLSKTNRIITPATALLFCSGFDDSGWKGAMVAGALICAGAIAAKLLIGRKTQDQAPEMVQAVQQDQQVAIPIPNLIVQEAIDPLEEIYKEVAEFSSPSHKTLSKALVALEKTDWSSQQKHDLLASLARMAGRRGVIAAFATLPEALAALQETDWSSRKKLEYLTSLSERSREDTSKVFDYLPFLLPLSSKETIGKNFNRLNDLLKWVTDYNRDKVLKLLQMERTLPTFRNMGPEKFSAFFDLFVTIFERWPRIGLQVLEGLIEAIQKGIIDDDVSGERESILAFVKTTHGFVPAVYWAYLMDGYAVLLKIKRYGEEMLADRLGPEEILKIIKDYEGRGGYDFLLAVVQSVSPTSGASFVTKAGQTGLMLKMLKVKDRRGDIPERWRGQIKTFALDRGEWRPKEGETIDPDGKIRDLLNCFRVGEGKKIEEQELVEGLEQYLQSERDERAQEAVRAVLFAYAGSQDALREKIDRIQDNDYAALDLLDQLFRDKDNLTVMLKTALDKVPVEYFAGKKAEKSETATRPIEKNGADLAKALRKVWNNRDLPETRRLIILSNMLKVYSQADIELHILNRAEIKKTPLAEALRTAMQEGPSISKHEIAEEILAAPLKLIETEKAKFEYQAAQPMTVGVRAVKGQAFGLHGLSSGVCTADDIELWKNPNFKLLAVTDEESRQVVGYVHLFESTDNEGRKILTLPGINPSAEFMATVDAEKFYDGLMAKIIEFAREGEYASVVIPTAANIHSNRQGIQKVILRKKYKITKIPEVRWNTVPDPYPFEEVYEVV